MRHYWRPGGLENVAIEPYVWQDFGYTYTYDDSAGSSKSYLIALTDTSGKVWWDQPSYDHLDRVVSVRKGSAYYTQRTYRPTDGVLTALKTGTSVDGTTVQNLSFAFDGLGNLTSRGDTLHNSLSESFEYDILNRYVKRNGEVLAIYADNGNITNKNDVSNNQSGAYAYDANKPHAVTSVPGFGLSLTYDANGNMLTRSGNGHAWAAKWAGFDKPRWLAKDGKGSEFTYNANRSRVIHLEFDAMSDNEPSHYTHKKLYALGPTVEVDYENREAQGVSAVWKLGTVRIYVPGPDGAAGTFEYRPSAGFSQAQRLMVYHYDHLGSIESITPWGSINNTYALDDSGKSSRYSYDPWGERRDPTDWNGAPQTTADGGHDDLTPRGFTYHEMLDDLGLVHMNGRIYDGLLGRMLSADLWVQSPGNLQSFNRYTYVANNPLTMTDSSGFSIDDPSDNWFIKKSNEHKAAGNGWRAMGYAILGAPKLVVEGTIWGFRHGAPQAMSGVKEGLAQEEAKGGAGTGILVGAARATLGVAEVGLGVPIAGANADRIPEVLADFPGKIKSDVENFVENPSVSNGANLVEDAAALYGGAKLLQAGVKRLAGAADEAATAGASAAEGGSEALAAQAAAEANAGARLAQMEAGNPGAHFVKYHGAQVTDAQLLDRAVMGIKPDGSIGNPVDASAFVSNQAQLAAAEMAQARFAQTGKAVDSFEMGSTVGRGYPAGGGVLTTTTNVTAVFKNGQLLTLYPKITPLK